MDHVDAIQLLVVRSGIEDAPVTFDPRANVWRLFKRWRVMFSLDKMSYCLTIPRGFPFDLASIPRIFTRLIARFELGIEPPLVHDYLYSLGGRPPRGRINPYRRFDREEADRIFLDLMLRRGIKKWKAYLAFIAVRLFGWAAWRGSV